MKYNTQCPERSPNGKYHVLIITSGRILRWPYRASDPPPKYKTKEEAKKVIKEYVKFTENMDRTPRLTEEFEIIEVSTETK